MPVGPHVSVVIPVHNEQDDVAELIRSLREALAQPHEIIFIDDGSYDKTFARLSELTADDPRVTIIQFMKKFGQTAGMAAGFSAARGRVIVPMDGDLQNDPHDIPRLVAKLDEGRGWDIVSGWRKNRRDKIFSRKLPSRIANRLIKKMTWTQEIHDFGCTMKAYRREVLEDVHLYGEMHRFLPAICKWRGARITEEVVNHRARVAGESKYGLKRTIKVLLDLLTVKFLGDYLTKPIYFFGKLTMLFMLIAFGSLGLAICQKYGLLYWGENNETLPLNRNVLVLFSMLTFLLSIMFLMLGVMSELLVRIYHESQNLKPYKVRRVFHGGAEDEDEPTETKLKVRSAS